MFSFYQQIRTDGNTNTKYCKIINIVLQTLLVTGGERSSLLSSTEIHVLSSSGWSSVASLPSARAYFPAVNVNNAVYVFGKTNSDFYLYHQNYFLGGYGGSGKYYDDIYRYDHVRNSWLDPAGHRAGKMLVAKYQHQAAPSEDVEKFCS